MNTVTLPRNKYIKILETQEELRGDVFRLKEIVSYIAQDEISPTYARKLSKIEKSLSAGGGARFGGTRGVKKFFREL
jgi:hypothetical protein